MIKEFKAFIMRGNVLDLAVAVVIGAAFGAIITSFVNDLIMPIVSVLTGGVALPTCSMRLTAIRMLRWPMHKKQVQPC